MKKIYKSLLMFLVVVVACQDPVTPPEETGTLVLSLAPDELTLARTIEPEVDMTIAYYEVEGSDDDGNTFSQTVTEGELLQTSLLPGSWTIVVTGFNANSTAIVSGETVVSILAGEVTSATVIVGPIGGTGTLSIDVIWPDSVLSDPAVTGTLHPALGTGWHITFGIGPDADSAGYVAELPNGYYTVALQLSDLGTVVWGVVEGARILAGELSHHTYRLTKDVNRGGLDLTIIDSLDNPIDITFSGVREFLPEGTDMTVTAATSEPVDSYHYFLQGAPLTASKTNPSITLGSDLPPGTYWLSLKVLKGQIISTESVVFEVVQRHHRCGNPDHHRSGKSKCSFYSRR